jgi:hypothetical protein
LTYRILPPDEWAKLLPIMAGREQNIPSPHVATAAVAESETGEVIGVLFLQMAFHVEPLVLTSKHVSFLRLHGELMNALADRKGLKYYCFSDQEIVGRMAEKAGMTKLPYDAVWQGEV